MYQASPPYSLQNNKMYEPDDTEIPIQCSTLEKLSGKKNDKDIVSDTWLRHMKNQIFSQNEISIIDINLGTLFYVHLYESECTLSERFKIIFDHLERTRLNINFSCYVHENTQAIE